jgi:Uma2 family endonuclease
MTISSSPVASDLTNSIAPLRFPSNLRLTPDQFALLCAENRDAVLELAADGRVLSMTPTGSETGARKSRLEKRLLLWAERTCR